MKNEFRLFNNDCLKILDELIEQKVEVDAIITDPPYGTTECEWDLVIDENVLIPKLDKIIKPNGWLILFGNSPFYDHLLVNATKKFNGKQLFKYSQELIWEKHSPTNPLSASQQLLRIHEKVMILCSTKKEQGKKQIFNPYTKTPLGRSRTMATDDGIEHLGIEGAKKKVITGSEFQALNKRTNGGHREVPKSFDWWLKNGKHKIEYEFSNEIERERERDSSKEDP